jgi:hypothetical protein
MDELPSAIRTFNLLGGIAMEDKKLYEEIQRHEMLMLAANGNVDVLKSKLQSVTIKSIPQAERVFYDALLAHASGDNVTAKNKLSWLVANNSFFDEGVVAAANVARQNTSNKLGAYMILANATQLNPHSVKLLKAFILEARAQGFDDFATTAQLTLAEVLPEPLYKKFVSSLR